MTAREALGFIAALSRQETDDLYATEADELMDEMDVSEKLRELVVADVVGGQYQCFACFPDGCGRFSEEALPNTRRRGNVICEENATWREKEQHARDVWDQPVSRIALVHEIAKAGQEEEIPARHTQKEMIR